MKEALLLEAQRFGTWLASYVFREIIGEEENSEIGNRMFCSRILKSSSPPYGRLCACIQKYVIGNGIS
jgi:hypothetical protein